MLGMVIEADTTERTMGHVSFQPPRRHCLCQQLPEISIASWATHKEHLRYYDSNEGQE
jgi:hypothetical protein